MYEFKDFKEVYRGSEIKKSGAKIRNEIIYKNKFDSNYSIKRIYLDDKYSILLSQFSYYKNQLNGPYQTYQFGKIYEKGLMKNNKEKWRKINV